jgi:hypothetical protein
MHNFIVQLCTRIAIFTCVAQPRRRRHDPILNSALTVEKVIDTASQPTSPQQPFQHIRELYLSTPNRDTPQLGRVSCGSQSVLYLTNWALGMGEAPHGTCAMVMAMVIV